MERKTIYIAFLLFGILSSLIYSCDEGEDCDFPPSLISSKKHTYTYTNETNFSINLEYWKGGISTSYNLEPSKKIIFHDEGSLRNCTVDGIKSSENWCVLVLADSLKIIFDNTKILTLKQDDTRDINILKVVNYSIEFEEYDQIEEYDEIWNLRYSFTQKDYNLAEDCDGNCE